MPLLIEEQKIKVKNGEHINENWSRKKSKGLGRRRTNGGRRHATSDTIIYRNIREPEAWLK